MLFAQGNVLFTKHTLFHKKSTFHKKSRFFRRKSRRENHPNPTADKRTTMKKNVFMPKSFFGNASSFFLR